MASQPNFLFFITDQHRADHLGCYGNRIVRTPSLDALARRGIVYDRYYVTTPVCMCNRATIMTGRMPSLHGGRHNGIPLSRDDVTFVDLLRAAGYRTGLVGKSHLQNMTGNPPVLRYEPKEGLFTPPNDLREARRSRRAGPLYEDENPFHWREDSTHDIHRPYYGFDFTRICTDHADEVAGHYERWLLERRPDGNALRGRANCDSDNRYKAPQAWRTRLPEELYPTTYVADMAIEFLNKHARTDDPFFLMVSFPDPHHPFTPPGKYWDMFDPATIPLPASFGQGDLPPLIAMRKAFEEGRAIRTDQRPFAVTEEEAKAIIALTYGMITMIDDQIARVIAMLEEIGKVEETVIVFTSDHGDYMGDHGIMLKLLLHYHGLIRVPFIWADPRAQRTGRTTDLGSSIDIAQTILARAGIQPYHGIQGRDLFGTKSSDVVLIEEDGQRLLPGYVAPARVRTLVTDRWRFTFRLGENWGELFDLVDDPLELNNLWNDPSCAKIQAELFAKLASTIIKHQDRAPLPTGLA